MKQQLEALKKKTHKAEPVSCEDIEACQQTLNSIIESGGGPIGDE
jgi:putative aminopeptidase FrvX